MNKLIVIILFERHLDYDARLNLDYIKAHPESGITIKKGGK